MCSFFFLLLFLNALLHTLQLTPSSQQFINSLYSFYKELLGINYTLATVLINKHRNSCREQDKLHELTADIRFTLLFTISMHSPLRCLENTADFSEHTSRLRSPVKPLLTTPHQAELLSCYIYFWNISPWIFYLPLINILLIYLFMFYTILYVNIFINVFY